MTIVAYGIALKASSGIFELAVRFAFTGFAAMSMSDEITFMCFFHGSSNSSQ